MLISTPRTSRRIASLLLGLAGFAMAQGPVGTLTGTITDPANAVVPGATVVAINAATSVETTTTTTNTGRLHAALSARGFL